MIQFQLSKMRLYSLNNELVNDYLSIKTNFDNNIVM